MASNSEPVRTEPKRILVWAVLSREEWKQIKRDALDADLPVQIYAGNVLRESIKKGQRNVT